MAHIQKRGPKKWKARYRGPDGHERSRQFERRIDAERWLATSTADVARGAWIDPRAGKIPFTEWEARWEQSLSNLRPTTRALNVGIAHNYLLPRFGSWSLAAITTNDVKVLLADGLGSGVSTSAARRRVLVLARSSRPRSRTDA